MTRFEENLKESFRLVKRDIVQLQDAFMALNSTQDKMLDTFKRQHDRLNKHAKLVDELEAKLKSVAKLENRLEKVANSFEKKLSSVEKKTTSVEKKVESNKKALATTKKEVTATKKVAKKAEKQASKNAKKVASNKKAIAKPKTQVKTVTKKTTKVVTKPAHKYIGSAASKLFFESNSPRVRSIRKENRAYFNTKAAAKKAGYKEE